MKKHSQLIIVIILIFIFEFISYYIYERKTENEKDYGLITVVTYDRFTTLMNDGGTHFNRKYIIDLNKKILKKYEDYYVGFEGYKYQDKLLYEKELNKNSIKEIKNIIEEIINNKEKYGTDADKKYIFYTISSEAFEEIKIYDSNIIKQMENIFAQ